MPHLPHSVIWGTGCKYSFTLFKEYVLNQSWTWFQPPIRPKKYDSHSCYSKSAAVKNSYTKCLPPSLVPWSKSPGHFSLILKIMVSIYQTVQGLHKYVFVHNKMGKAMTIKLYTFKNKTNICWIPHQYQAIFWVVGEMRWTKDIVICESGGSPPHWMLGVRSLVLQKTKEIQSMLPREREGTL